MAKILSHVAYKRVSNDPMKILERLNCVVCKVESPEKELSKFCGREEVRLLVDRPKNSCLVGERAGI